MSGVGGSGRNGSGKRSDSGSPIGTMVIAIANAQTALRSIWHVSSQVSTTRKIFGTVLTVGALTLLAKLAVIGKELVVAAQFGTGDAVDAFLIAFLLPSFAINVVAGSFSAAFIPTYIQVREREGPAAAQRLFSSIMVLSIALLAGVLIILVLTASYSLPILGSGFGPEKLVLTRSLFFVLLPCLFLNGAAMIWAAILNAGERFALAAITPMLTPIAAAVISLLGGNTWGIFALAFGTVGGMAMEAVLLGAALKRQGIRLRPRWREMTPHLRRVAGQYTPMMAGAVLMSGTVLVDQAMAAMLEPGSVAILNYGNKVISFPLNLAATALGTAILPYFAKMVASGDRKAVQETFKRYLHLIFVTAVPFVIILVLFSEPLVEALFRREAFTSEDAGLVASVLGLYAFQIPFYIAGILLVRLISALRMNHILMLGAIISLILNIVLNYIFISQIGVAGIALSTSCVYMVSFLYLYMNYKNARIVSRLDGCR